MTGPGVNDPRQPRQHARRRAREAWLGTNDAPATSPEVQSAVPSADASTASAGATPAVPVQPAAPPTAPTAPTSPQQRPQPSPSPQPADTQERLRAAGPRTPRHAQRPGTAPEAQTAAPPRQQPSAQPGQQSSSRHLSAGAGDPATSQFVEPGRGHLGADGGGEATPAHLDPRLTGLEPQVVRRGWFGRRKSEDFLDDNPTSRRLTEQARLPLRIAVVGLKGGVGKTTLSILLATAAAQARRHPVLLLDSDTTYGSLMLRTGIVPRATAHDIAAMGDPGSLQLLMTSISSTPDNVWVLPSGRSPDQSARFDDHTYVDAVRAVYRHFPLTVTDCGAGMAGPLMSRVITASHALVLATSPSMDGLLASHNALQWLKSLGHDDLMRRTIVAITNVPNDPPIDLAETRKRFADISAGVVAVPTDPHLSPGSHLVYGSLSERTRRAANDLASVATAAALSAQ